MLIFTDCGYNEADLPSRFRNAGLSFKTVLTVVGRHFIVTTCTSGIEEKNSPLACLRSCILNIFFISPIQIIDQSTTVPIFHHNFKYWRDPKHSLLTGSTVSTTHSPVTSLQIWFVWRYSWCFIYFCPPRQPAGTLWVSWFIRME